MSTQSNPSNPMETILTQTAGAIRQAIEQGALPEVHPGKVSCFIKFVRFVPLDGATIEEAVGPVQKLIFTVTTYEDLLHQVAENLLLAVYGAEVQIVSEMPNLIVKLFDRKVRVKMAGTAPLDAPGQLFLKATVYRYEPSIWEQLFRRPPDQHG